MHSKDKLAQELRNAELDVMAGRAAEGYYHDYLSPHPTPCIQLAADLKAAGTPAALALLKRHLNGEFDATLEESNDWMESKDGKEAMAALPPGVRHLFGGK